MLECLSHGGMAEWMKVYGVQFHPSSARRTTRRALWQTAENTEGWQSGRLHLS